MLCLYDKDDIRNKECPLSMLRLSPKDDIMEPQSTHNLHQSALHGEEQMLLRWVGIGFAARRSTCVGAQSRLQGWKGLTFYAVSFMCRT